jgi:hypothetical protein
LKGLRPLGHVLLDLEPLLEELVIDHELQWGDVLSLIHAHLQVHLPSGQEEYLDGTHPEFHYKQKE